MTYLNVVVFISSGEKMASIEAFEIRFCVKYTSNILGKVVFGTGLCHMTEQVYWLVCTVHLYFNFQNLQPPAPLVKVVTNNKMSDTVSTERSSILKKGRSLSAPARGKENRLQEYEREDSASVYSGVTKLLDPFTRKWVWFNWQLLNFNTICTMIITVIVNDEVNW